MIESTKLNGFNLLPSDVLSCIFSNLRPVDVMINAMVCKVFWDFSLQPGLWSAIARDRGINFQSQNLNDLKVKLVLKDVMPEIDQFPPLLIEAFGGPVQVFRLEKLRCEKIKDFTAIQPDDMAGDFMRGVVEGRPFVAFKYLNEYGFKGVEVFIQSENCKNHNDWTCSSLLAFDQSCGLSLISPSRFITLQKFFETGESELEVFNSLSEKIYKIPVETEAPTGVGRSDRSSKRIGKLYKRTKEKLHFMGVGPRSK